MHRSKDGRFAVAREEHRYKLFFSEGPEEYISAPGPTEAVAKRVNPLLPYQITDETVMAGWINATMGRRLDGAEAQTLLTERNPSRPFAQRLG